jgi:hypothetical protein
MKSVSMKERAAALAAVREHKDTEPVRLVLALMELRVEALRQALITANQDDVPVLQGAARELQSLHSAITGEHKSGTDADGAYA